MITRILLLALATSVAGLHAEEAAPAGDKPKHERGSEGRGEGRGERGFPGLSAEEQAKVKAALEAVKDDPAVIAAREAAKKAREAVKEAREAGKTKEEMADLFKAAMEAGKASMEAGAAAAIAKDPSVKELFDKIKAEFAKRGEGRGRGEGQGGEGKPGEGRKGGRKGPPPAEEPAK